MTALVYQPRVRFGSLRDGYQTAQQITHTGGQIAAGAVTATAAASTAAIAVPIIGAAVLGVTLVLGSIAKRNAQKRAATKIVDDVGPQLEANLKAYMDGPRTRSSQRQALANFDYGWQLILENCGNPELGSAGERCIDERRRGGVAPWCPTSDHRGCDYFTTLRDPIENDPDVREDNVITDAVSELFPSASRSELGTMLALAAGIGLVVWGITQ